MLYSLVAQRVKRLPAVWEIWVRSLGQEDPPEKEMATHTSTLAWKTPWTEEPVHRIAKSQTQLGTCVRTHSHTHTLKHMEYRMRKSHSYYSKAIQT